MSLRLLRSSGEWVEGYAMTVTRPTVAMRAHSVQRAVSGVKYKLRVSALRYRPMTTYVFLAK
jgi:hypothetical protein